MNHIFDIPRQNVETLIVFLISGILVISSNNLIESKCIMLRFQHALIYVVYY